MRKVLDLGCGPIPPTLEIFLERDVEVKYIGIDGSKEVINTAKRNYENNKFNQALIPCEWKLNGKYDLVTAFTFMDWLNR
ncbi:MAG: methyltransferase domain-containing protein, partial [Candidatus Aenigmarchaeota archaeon]|nr:methyltransferase domain-containing protein [Candidatus Aenigmarchaeota archaeon]